MTVDEGSKPTVRMTEDEAWTMIAEAPVGILTTLRTDGTPVALPLWFVALDRCIYTSTRGKKLERVARDGRSSFLVDAGSAWSELRAVHLTGHSDVLDGDDDVLPTVLAALADKYGALRARGAAMPKVSREAYKRASGGVIRFTPDPSILTWDNRKITAPLENA